jgi:hypothetical protein
VSNEHFLEKKAGSLGKIEILSQLRDMQGKAQKYRSEEHFDDAIILSDKIMRLAVKYELPSIIKDQKEFIKQIAKEVEKDYFKPKIKQFAGWILNQYDKLAQSDGIYQAHNLVKSLKESYGDLAGFNSISEVKEIIEKDEKAWLKFKIKRQTN